MWLFAIALLLILLGAVGGILTGGVFTIVILPLGVIALITAVATGSLAGMRERRREGMAAPEPPLPHTAPNGTSGAPSSPEELVDARRVQQ